MSEAQKNFLAGANMRFDEFLSARAAAGIC